MIISTFLPEVENQNVSLLKQKESNILFSSLVFGVTFIIVSLLDLTITSLLISYTEGAGKSAFYESNAVASFYFKNWGISGLIWFKTGMVLLVTLIATFIHIHKPKMAMSVLAFASLATFAVVFYSTGLAYWWMVYGAKTH